MRPICSFFLSSTHNPPPHRWRTGGGPFTIPDRTIALLRVSLDEYKAPGKAVNNNVISRTIDLVKGVASVLVTAQRTDTMMGNSARLIKEKFLVLGLDFYGQGAMGRDFVTTAGAQYMVPALAQRVLAVRSFSRGM